MKKFLVALLCLINLILVFTFNVKKVNADTGPKPSTTVTFKNVPFENAEIGFLYYLERNTNLTGETFEKRGYDVESVDDYKYIYHAKSVGEGNHTIKWTYFCPYDLKVFLYDKDTKTMYMSKVIHREEFTSNYVIDCKNIENGKLIVKSKNSFGTSVLSLVGRIIITIAIEVGIAFLFKFKKKSYISICAVNVISQILLNLFLYFEMKNFGGGNLIFLLAFIPIPLLIFILGEIFVIVLEGLIYKFTTWGPKGRGQNAFLYSLCANCMSIVLGGLILILMLN